MAAEIVSLLVKHGRLERLRAFASGLPASALTDERVHLGRAMVAASEGDLDLLERLLDRHFATVREGENLLDELWVALQRGRLQQALKRAPSSAELAERLKQHPVPAHLNFRMRAVDEVK